MKSNFNKCFQLLMADEGGYTNDPNDSGGATKYGITIYDYRKYIKAGATPADVKTLTQAQAKTIYKSKYWDTLDCDNLPSGVDDACFNYGVLAGIGRPKADLKRFADIKDPNKLVDAICDEMQTFLSNLSASGKNATFRKGWLARVKRLRSNSHQMNQTKIAGGVAAGTVTAAASMYHWGTQHWVPIAFAVILVGLAVSFAIYKYKAK